MKLMYRHSQSIGIDLEDSSASGMKENLQKLKLDVKTLNLFFCDDFRWLFETRLVGECVLCGDNVEGFCRNPP